MSVGRWGETGKRSPILKAVLFCVAPYLQPHSPECLVRRGCHHSQERNPTMQAKTPYKSSAIGHNEVGLLHSYCH